MSLEILDYDVIGRGLSLLVRYRRRPVFASDPSLPVPKNADGSPAVAVDAAGVATKMVQPAGPVTQIRIEKDEVDGKTWEGLTSSFDLLEGIIGGIAEARVAALVATPATLDAKIDEAFRAQAAAEAATRDALAKSAELDGQIAAKQQALAALEPTETRDDVPSSP